MKTVICRYTLQKHQSDIIFVNVTSLNISEVSQVHDYDEEW